MNITFGSFDTPFGYDSNNISNNADTFNTAFILNSLPYSALDGQMSQLNTLGLKLENSFKYLDLTTVSVMEPVRQPTTKVERLKS